MDSIGYSAAPQVLWGRGALDGIKPEKKKDTGSACFLPSLRLHSGRPPAPGLRRDTPPRHTVLWAVPLGRAEAGGGEPEGWKPAAAAAAAERGQFCVVLANVGAVCKVSLARSFWSREGYSSLVNIVLTCFK